MKVNHVKEISEKEFDAQVLQSNRPALVGFLSDWSEACGRFEPVLEETAGACQGSATVFKVDVDDNPDLGTLYAIQSVPTLICFINGVMRMKIVGTVSAKAILAKLRSVSQQNNSAAGPGSEPTSLNPEI
jgi:thioredoxin 1